MSINLVTQTTSTLASSARLAGNAQLSALLTSNPTLIASLNAAATVAIQRETKRALLEATYAEYVSGGNHPYDVLFLQEFPVTAITRVATNPQTVLTVTNANTTLNQRATVATIGTTVRLYRVASGVATTNDLSTATYVTVTAIANAINAIGYGWTATVQGGFGLYATADLKPLQGAYTALNGGADLQIYTEELGSRASAGWSDDCDRGSLGIGQWRLDDKAGTLYGRFPRGHLNVRVDYTAGFAVIPDDLQEACVQMTLDLYNSGLVNQTMKSGGLGPYRFEINSLAGAMSTKVKGLISYYKDRGKLNLHR